MQTKHLTAHLKIKSLNEETGVFDGYGSIFGNVDTYGEVMERGCFTESLKQKGAKGIKMLWQHDATQPIGIYESMEEDELGLKVRGRLLINEIPKAKECLALMKAGALDGLSIGFQYVDGGMTIDSKGITLLNNVDLWEVSPVTFPANTDALVTSIKNVMIDEIASKKDLAIFLHKTGFSKATAIQIAKKGFRTKMKRKTDEDFEFEMDEDEKRRARRRKENEDEREEDGRKEDDDRDDDDRNEDGRKEDDMERDMRDLIKLINEFVKRLEDY